MPFLLFLKGLDLKSWVIVALSVVISLMWVNIKAKNIQIREATVAAGEYKGTIQELTLAVKKQSDAVDELSKRNSEFADVLETAGEQNARMTEEANRMIAMLRKTKVPTDCKGAVDHLDAFTQTFVKEWNK